MDYDDLLAILRRISDDYGEKIDDEAYKQDFETLRQWFESRGIQFPAFLQMGHKMVENQIRAMLEGVCSEDQVPIAIYVAGFQLGWEAAVERIATSSASSS